MNSKYKISGMHCASCAVTIQKELNNTPGVEKAEVNIATEIATIQHGDHSSLDIASVNSRLSKLGYSLTEEGRDNHRHKSDGEHENHGGQHSHNISKEILISSLAITILTIILMILDFFGSPSETAREFIHHLFPLLALYMLAIPGSRYIDALVRYVRYGHANMDTLIGLGTVTAFTYSFIITAFEESLRSYIDVNAHYYDTTIVIIGFITLGKYLETFTKNKTKKALEDLLKLQPTTTFLKNNNNYTEVPISEIKINDTILVKAGANIPVDGDIINTTESIFINESSITGESVPTQKNNGDKVFSGTTNTNRPFEMRAAKIGNETLLSQIVRMVEDAQNSKAPIQKLADTISSVFVPTVLVIAIITLFTWLFIGYTYGVENYIALALSSFVGVLIIACPCALGLATPVAIITGVGKAAKNGILIKNAEALEHLKDSDTLIIDKTGTLTEGHLKVKSIITAENISEHDLIRKIASLEKFSNHPIADALVNYAQENKIELLAVNNTENIEGFGFSGKIENNSYLVGNAKLLEKNNIIIPDEISSQIDSTYGSVAYLAENGICMGAVLVDDNIRATAQEAINKIKAENINIIMATGDNETQAKKVAKILGIARWQSHSLPQDKLDLIKKLQSSNKKVTMVGDGINDAPALAQADVSIAVSAGTDIAINTSDITLLHSDITKIEKAIHISRITFRIVKQNLFWAFSYNIIGIPLASGALYPLFGVTLSPEFAAGAMAFSSVAVVLNALRNR